MILRRRRHAVTPGISNYLPKKIGLVKATIVVGSAGSDCTRRTSAPDTVDPRAALERAGEDQERRDLSSIFGFRSLQPIMVEFVASMAHGRLPLAGLDIHRNLISSWLSQ
ncbi:MAG TPA: hypothetical protein VLM79_38790 [Kofleriaceae bacterium]|nr:hypothetical protein [Kofleriaceae bacterium]